MYFVNCISNLSLYIQNYAIAKSIVWQLEAWKTIIEEFKWCFQSRMSSLVGENGTEYDTNNDSNSIMAI